MSSRALIAACIAAATRFAIADEIATAKYRWARSPHGAMLERILPPAIEPAQLPEPASAGARLTAAYCVQCHHLPNPAMHSAARWTVVVERMVWRMQGKGNLGPLMQDMMGDVKAPSESDASMLVRYLQKNAQRELDIKQFPDIHTPAGRIYSIACTQCHVLPDPLRHTAREWPAIVERMRRNMAWANRVTGDPVLRTSPELDTGEIVRFLQRNSRVK